MSSILKSVPGKGAETNIPGSEKIPFREKIAFAGGVNADSLSAGLMTGIWMPFFNIGMGMSPVVLGVILMVLRAWDAFADPVIGNLSDNARTRWGRRKPFMVCGIIATGCIYPLLWFMPEMGSAGKIAYLIGVGMLFYTAYSCWAMPYYGMQLELTPNYDERTRLTFWMSIAGAFGAFVGGWVLALVTSAIFVNPGTGKPDIVLGMRWVCWGIAILFVVAGLLPALFVTERFPRGKSARNASNEKLWDSIKDSATCRPLWNLIATSCFLQFGMVSVGSLWQYANIYYIFGGDIGAASVLAGWKSSATVVTALAAAPMWVALAERFDKMKVLIGMLTLMIISHLLNLFLMRPDMPYLQLITGGAEAAGFAGFWMLLPSMKADVSDYDELQTGRRREGSLNAFYSWFLKLGGTASLGASGFLLQLTGYDAHLSSQPHGVLKFMFYAYIFVPIVFWFGAICVASFYRLSRERMADVRFTLEERRGTL